MNEELREFLTDYQQVMDDVYERRWDLLDQTLAVLFAEAWLQARPTVALLQEQLNSQDAELNYRLEVCGLKGAQLTMKTQQARLSFSDWLIEKSKRKLRRVLKWSNILLGSLAAVLPPAHALKEIKESVEAGIDEAEQPLP
ncbi:MAG TPA: hypothetical protein VFR81_18020 [Longimicrobium sp.]|nr:hypothetical protein [Longimicrobium sp.]